MLHICIVSDRKDYVIKITSNRKTDFQKNRLIAMQKNLFSDRKNISNFVFVTRKYVNESFSFFLLFRISLLISKKIRPKVQNV